MGRSQGGTGPRHVVSPPLMALLVMTPKEIRRANGWSMSRAAALAGVSETVVRVYEANPDAVSPLSRQALDRVYREARERLIHKLMGKS